MAATAVEVVEFAAARRIAGRIPPTLQLADVLVALVEPQHAAPLVKALSKDLPLGSLQHLKRVRRYDSGKDSPAMMQLILHTLAHLRSGRAADASVEPGPSSSSDGGAVSKAAGGLAGGGGKAGASPSSSTPSSGSTCTCFAAHHTHRHPTLHVVATAGGPCSGKCSACVKPAAPPAAPLAMLPAASPAAAALAPLLPPRVAAALAAAAASLDVARVPAVAPDNRDQWSEWNKIWPMPWKLPSGQPHQDGQTAGDADQLYFERHMARVVASSRAAAGANVCLIIDPSNGEVIAEASDCTALHPLRHAVMEAVAAAAERDLRLWPVNGFVHLGRQEDTSVHGVNTIVDGANGGGGGGANGELVVSNGAASGSASGDDEGTGRPAAQERPQEQAAERPEQQHPPPPPQQQQQQQAQQQQHEDHLLSGLKHCHSQEDGLGVDSPAKRQRVTNGFASHSKPCSSTSKAGGGEEQPVGAAVADEVQQQQGEQQQETQQQEEERQPLPPLPPQQQQQPLEGRQERQQQSDGPAPANNPVSVPQEQPKRPASASPSADGGAGAEDGSSGNSASGGVSGLSRLPTPVPITSWANKPYLCNTYDAFLLREPCAMCGMALVHSRLARVVYCEADGRHGALGGAFRLQANRSLNHHYDVFHMPAERRSSKAAGGKAAAKAAAAVAVVAAATAAAAAPGVA